ncbi:tetratricopeptide repeat protein [Pedobacter frigiditerrae]|uniref:Tetratricopeptide repeat protein n=1 Tax=Pedobacter frigiditerrae TaxID=2530452 RepID=A0A4R0MT78_9SPHI|nr:tetratricopeptide repeat protein [Pedobacter frigiditerrae]TCC90261.1 tetratricopeptide repeat protein [Pedobacter frigiditerrae]
MKKLLLSILFVGVALLANAQKSEIAEAKKAWDLFTLVSGGKQPFDKTMASLNKGLGHTDLAIANEKSKVLPDAWSYRALFASAIALTDSVNAENSLAKQKIAEEAIEKAKSLDAKSSEKDNLATAQLNIRNAISGRAVRAYYKKDYAIALAMFNQLIALNPNDTSMYVNAAVTAKLAKDYPQAIEKYKKIISLNVPQVKDFYSEAITTNLEFVKDTTAALALLKEASAKYPDDAAFIGVETDIYIVRGDIVKSQEMLNKLIARDPKKPIYHHLMGDTYYKQALEIQAQKNKLDQKKIKELDALTAKMTKLIDEALPHYKKATELDTNYVPSLESLKQIYGFKNDAKNFDDVKKRLDAIPAKN